MSETAAAGAGVGAGAGEAGSAEWPVLEMSVHAQRTFNPIRDIVDKIAKPPKFINLALGDPTVYHNLSPPSIFLDAVREQVDVESSRGYGHSAGLPEARQAIAERYTCEAAPITADDIVIGSGGSGAIDLAIAALANEGDNILLPKPAFALYEVICKARNISVKYYDLKPESGWEADLEQLDSLVDENTKAVVLNNPSNPCGSVYSKEHLLAFLAVVEKHKLTVISDEIYGNMVFDDAEFFALSTLTQTVPVLTISGLAKEFLAPGWRVGWVIVHDNKYGTLKNIRTGLYKLAMLVLGACTLIQRAIPRILTPKTDEDKKIVAESLEAYRSTIQENARFVEARCEEIECLVPTKPQGALYTMFGIDVSKMPDIESDFDFSQKLLSEECVFMLPGQCFNMKNFIRMVVCAPKDVLEDALVRIERFCKAHTA